MAATNTSRRRPVADDMPSIFEAIAAGASLRAACADAGLDAPSAVHLIDADEELAKAYARAKEDRADGLFEEILHIADTTKVGEKVTTKADGKVETVTGDMVERARLQVDARKWVLARMSSRYSEKVSLEHSGPNGGPLPVTIFQLPDNGRGTT